MACERFDTRFERARAGARARVASAAMGLFWKSKEQKEVALRDAAKKGDLATLKRLATTLRPGDRGATFQNYSKTLTSILSRPHPHAHLP